MVAAHFKQEFEGRCLVCVLALSKLYERLILSRNLKVVVWSGQAI